MIRFTARCLLPIACCVLFVCCLLSPGSGEAANTVRAFTCLTGTGTGCVGKINLSELVDGDIGIAVVTDVLYVYQFDADATNPESSPMYIHPAGFVTQGVWILADIVAKNSNTLTQLKVPSSDAGPTATAGYLRHDSTVTNHANGALRWHDGTNIRQVVDLVAATAEACTDTQVVAYSTTNDNFYCKDDAGAAGAVASDGIWDAAGDLVYGTGSNTATRLPIGTAGQVLVVNAGATAPAWTGTLSVAGLDLGGILLGDPTPNTNGAIGYSSNAFRFFGNSEDLLLTFGSDSLTLSSQTSIASLSFSAMNLATTGTIDGGIPVTKSTDATITVSGMTGFYINADDDVIAFDLPADPTNKAYCFANLLYARAISVNPADGDYIVHAGTTAAAGEAYVSTGARTDQLCVIGIDTSYWLVTAERGTWAEESP